jgi:DNA-binding beta-propeller fold protein YncE
VIRASRPGRPLVIAASTVVVLGAAATGGWLTLFHSTGIELPPDGWAPAAAILAGSGIDGLADGSAADAQFSDPFAVAIGPDGATYVADGGDSNSIRRISVDGFVSTVGGGQEGFRDGIGAMARLNTPSGIAVDGDGTIYVADTGNHAIRRITPFGRVGTLAGNGRPGWRDGYGRGAQFDGPMGLALEPRGLLVADAYNDRIRLVTRAGFVTTLAGRGGPGLQDGLALEAAFDTPTGIAAANGDVYVADTGNDVVRRIDTSGIVTTLGASGGAVVGLSRPTGIAVAADGRAYVSDRRTRILELLTGGRARVLAGGSPGFSNGIGGAIRFRNPTGIAVRHDGAVIVADAGNHLVRLLDLPSRLGSTLPAPPEIAPGFDLVRFARMPLIWPVDPLEGPHEIAGTIGEARGNAGGEGRERFHAGIDIHAPYGANVFAIRDAKIDLPIAAGAFDLLNEFLSAGPVTYVHIRVARDRLGLPLRPDLMPLAFDAAGLPSRVRVRRGSRIRAGDLIGTINRFQHVHLNVGPAGEEANPLLVGLPQFRDTIPPTIAPKGVEMVGINGDPIAARVHGRVPVCGLVNIVVEAWDRMDGNAQTRRLGAFRLGYQVLDSHEQPAPGFEQPRVTLEFDKLPSDADAPRTIYAPGSGIPFYGTRRTRFRYVVTTRVEDGRAVDTPWDSSTVPPGHYIVRVLVADAEGNEAIAGRDLPIVVMADELTGSGSQGRRVAE